MLKKLFSLDTGTTKRVFGLDVMRAIAILIVVDAHASVALGKYYNGAFWHHLLPDGVELFFVLSGFLIGGILIRSYEKKGRFDRDLLLNFWTRRWFRTLPNYYLVLGGLILFALVRSWRSGLLPVLPDGGVLAKYFVFIQNFASPTPGFFPETWSLAIEEWSYITLPLLLWIMHTLLSAQWSRQRIVLLTILSIIIGTNLYRLFIAIQIPIAEGELEFRGIVLTRLDAISYGVLGAYVRHYFPAYWTNESLRRRLFILGLILTVLTALSASILMLGFYANAGIIPAYTFYKRTIYFLVIGLSMTLWLPFMDGWRTAPDSLVRSGIARAITHISLISYSMYLLNLTPIMINFIERIPTTSSTIGWAKVGLFWVLVLILSTLLYKFFEKPVTELRERLSAKEPTQLIEQRAEGKSQRV
ncbi:acyltransferase family protein [Spirosoma validum]|uniref:Acyltransferase n=1 Tax=Spirosoma validum TaxID=2771355 RepID=A0A927AYT3_9BACT|nr:acyltransferase [Spirosoma validum]MBD2752359.1 acyltransferase [Spirosoma validum]